MHRRVGVGGELLCAPCRAFGCGQVAEAFHQVAIEWRRTSGATLVEQQEIATAQSAGESLHVQRGEVRYRGTGPSLEHHDGVGVAVFAGRGDDRDEEVDTTPVSDVAALGDRDGAASAFGETESAAL